MSEEQPAKLATGGRQGLLGQTHKTFQSFQPPANRQAFGANGGQGRDWKECERLGGGPSNLLDKRRGPWQSCFGVLTLGSDG